MLSLLLIMFNNIVKHNNKLINSIVDEFIVECIGGCDGPGVPVQPSIKKAHWVKHRSAEVPERSLTGSGYP